MKIEIGGVEWDNVIGGGTTTWTYRGELEQVQIIHWTSGSGAWEVQWGDAHDPFGENYRYKIFETRDEATVFAVAKALECK
jgi:hypothetical protein